VSLSETDVSAEATRYSEKSVYNKPIRRQKNEECRLLGCDVAWAYRKPLFRKRRHVTPKRQFIINPYGAKRMKNAVFSDVTLCGFIRN
jgi:hypothetical protein